MCPQTLKGIRSPGAEIAGTETWGKVKLACSWVWWHRPIDLGTQEAETYLAYQDHYKIRRLGKQLFSVGMFI